MSLEFIGYGGAHEYPCYKDAHGNIYFDIHFSQRELSLYTGAYKDATGSICGEPNTPVSYSVYPTNTIMQYFNRGGKWNIECDTSIPYRAMDVQIGFVNSDGEEDEVEFSIKPYDKRELSSLYKDFCKENNYPNNTVKYISVAKVAESMESLM